MGKFSDNLRIRRLQLLLSQEALAKRVGVTQAVICNYENGLNTPKLEIALRLAKALNTTIEQLAGEEEPNIL